MFDETKQKYKKSQQGKKKYNRGCDQSLSCQHCKHFQKINKQGNIFPKNNKSLSQGKKETVGNENSLIVTSKQFKFINKISSQKQKQLMKNSISKFEKQNPSIQLNGASLQIQKSQPLKFQEQQALKSISKISTETFQSTPSKNENFNSSNIKYKSEEKKQLFKDWFFESQSSKQQNDQKVNHKIKLKKQNHNNQKKQHQLDQKIFFSFDNDNPFNLPNEDLIFQQIALNYQTKMPYQESEKSISYQYREKQNLQLMKRIQQNIQQWKQIQKILVKPKRQQRCQYVYQVAIKLFFQDIVLWLQLPKNYGILQSKWLQYKKQIKNCLTKFVNKIVEIDEERRDKQGLSKQENTFYMMEHYLNQYKIQKKLFEKYKKQPQYFVAFAYLLKLSEKYKNASHPIKTQKIQVPNERNYLYIQAGQLMEKAKQYHRKRLNI